MEIIIMDNLDEDNKVVFNLINEPSYLNDRQISILLSADSLSYINTWFDQIKSKDKTFGYVFNMNQDKVKKLVIVNGKFNSRVFKNVRPIQIIPDMMLINLILSYEEEIKKPETMI